MCARHESKRIEYGYGVELGRLRPIFDISLHYIQNGNIQKAIRCIMLFHVLKPTRTIPKQQSPTFLLVQDSWNDYSYMTLYHLYFADSETTTNIGSIKILKKGQSKSDGLLIQDNFERLSEDFVSIGQSLDYYERLAALDENTRTEILSALRDAVKNSNLVSEFENEEGWGVSVFRDQNDKSIEEFLILARAMLEGNYTTMPTDDINFSFQVKGWENTLDLELANNVEIPFSLFHKVNLPSRLISVIGRNGSGKSTLLARIARVAHGTATNRNLRPLSELGMLKPEGIGFPRIITVSYSAFDSFELPGVSNQEREQIVKDVRRGEGRFVFCGLRDIATELEERLKTELSMSSPEHGKADRVSHTLLKPVNVLADEFVRTLELIQKKNRNEMYERTFKIISGDVSVDENSILANLKQFIENSPKEHFLRWSTGHKIVMQIMVSLVAHITPRSLILLDEPETHLHPPLLAALMHSIRYLLEDQKAFGIVATHSPVVIQETLSQHVYIVRREGSLTKLFRPSIETFGENVGMLTSEVFGMNSDATDFHKILDQMVTGLKNLEVIEKIFEPHGLSNQARAYVMSKLARLSGVA
jgi:predicted ATPase